MFKSDAVKKFTMIAGCPLLWTKKADFNETKSLPENFLELEAARRSWWNPLEKMSPSQKEGGTTNQKVNIQLRRRPHSFSSISSYIHLEYPVLLHWSSSCWCNPSLVTSVISFSFWVPQRLKPSSYIIIAVGSDWETIHWRHVMCPTKNVYNM